MSKSIHRTPTGSANRWALVLAAGEGTRLRALTTDRSGIAVPKQFCSLQGGPSLLEETLQRAARLAPRDRIVTVVAADHRPWWQSELANLPERSIVVQPSNRGTAPGILLPLLSILERDPKARIAVLPSDHFVADEISLAQSIGAAFDAVERDPGRLVLLGIEPDAPETEYGWILPRAGADFGLAEVEAFVEKPEARLAAELLARGAVWNSFLFVARAATLLKLFRKRLPELAAAFERTAKRKGDRAAALAELYQELEAADFSRRLLQQSAAELRLLSVLACGWSDLGTPTRVAQCLQRLPRATRRPRWFPVSPPAVVDLAQAVTSAAF